MTTGFSSNNVRNAFTPFGNADLLETGLFLAQTAHLGSPAELRRVVEMATSGAAGITGIAATHGLRVGAHADLVVLDATDPVSALLDRAPRRYVLKRGRVVAETEHVVTLHGPAARQESRRPGPLSGTGPAGEALDHWVILVTRPAPTVRPPSRIAKRRPSSMAIGWISSTDMSVLSPGMTISRPSGRVTTPVTSVVRK